MWFCESFFGNMNKFKAKRSCACSTMSHVKAKRSCAYMFNNVERLINIFDIECICRTSTLIVKFEILTYFVIL
jgi:hypothetical protein